MKRLPLILLLLILCGQLCAATRTSNGTGNWQTSGTWVGGNIPGNGDSAIIASGHTVTVDANTTVGASTTYSPLAASSASATGGGASGGSLPAGTYKYYTTHVDSAGHESCPGPEGQPVSISATNIPRISVGTLLTGVSSINLYLTNTGGASNTQRLYCTGITGTTVDLPSASWGNTYSAGSATGGSTAYASATPPPDPAITVTGALVVGSGATLTVRGDTHVGNTSITLKDDSVWEWDSSQCTSPSSVNFAVKWGTNDNQTSCKLLTSNTSAAHPATVRSNAGGANGYFRVQRTWPGTQWDNVGGYNCSYVNFLRVGDSTHNFETNARSSNVFTLSNCIFDACGMLNWLTATSSITISLSNCTWKNSVGSLAATFQSGSGAVSRTLTDCLFDKTIELPGNSFVYTRCLFQGNPAYNTGTNTNKWGGMDGCLLIFSGDFASYIKGDLTNSYILMKSSRTQLDNGTATSATSTTLSDTSKSWTTNQFSTPFRSVSIQSGTGAGQIRRIASNTSNQLTTSPAWDVTPDATSVYKIYSYASSDPNPFATVHGGSPAHSISGNIFEGADVATDADGIITDMSSGDVSVTNNLFIPSAIRNNSCVPVNVARTGAGGSLTFNHNTYFTGAQTLAVGEYNTQQAGAIAAFKSNLAFQFNDTSVSGTFSGSVKISDLTHLSSGGVSDIVSPSNADYNYSWNNVTACNYQGNGYNLNESSQPGSHDINASSGTGPDFVDSSRNLYKWGLSLGSTGSYEAVIDDAIAGIQTQNDFSGARSGYTIAALIAYVKAGFAPQNATLKNAGHDGVTIGAMEGIFPPATFPQIIISRQDRTINRIDLRTLHNPNPFAIAP